MNTSLFFLTKAGYFPEGTLLELPSDMVTAASLDPTADQPFNTVPEGDFHAFGYRIPDRGDGIPGFIGKADVIPCPPFAENIPPGRCPLRITCQRIRNSADPLYNENPNNIGIFGITIDTNLHWQKIVIPLPKKFPQIELVTLTNTLKNHEVDSYEQPRLEDLNNGRAYCLHIGHVGPGFYETNIRLDRGKYLLLRFIKFFPPEFNDRYKTVKDAAFIPGRRECSEVAMPVNLHHSHPDDREYEFPVDMMNKALEFATEWGPNFRKPINERMRSIYPSLTDEQIDKLKKITDEAESFILNLAERELSGQIGEYDIVPMAAKRFPWVYEDQLNRIKGIGMYWARK